MLSLILLLLFGAGVTYLSLQNTTPVTIYFQGRSFSDVPLFYVIIGSMLLGIVWAYIIYLVQSISTSITIMGKNKKIKQEQNEVLNLTKNIHQLEIENAGLKNDNNLDSEDSKSL